jgi:hypothetical protein
MIGSIIGAAVILFLAFEFMFAILVGPVHAQYDNRTYYGADGKVKGKSTTSSSGQTTFYGADGTVRGRAAPIGDGTIVIYDGNGNRAGSVTRRSK